MNRCQIKEEGEVGAREEGGGEGISNKWSAGDTRTGKMDGPEWAHLVKASGRTG